MIAIAIRPLLAEWIPRGLPIVPALLIALVLAATSIGLYARDRRALRGPLAWVLTVMRTSALLGILLVLVDPAWIETRPDRSRELLLVLDRSASMAVRDSQSASGTLTTRFEAALETLDRVEREIAGTLPFRRLLISRTLEPWTADAQPDGVDSDLTGPLLSEAMSRPRGSLAGIVLVSDGRHHADRDPRAEARRLGTLSIPVFTVGVGATSPPRDLAIRDAETSPIVFVGDEVLLDVAIESHGFTARRVDLSLLDDADTLARWTIEPTDGVTHWPLSFVASTAGRRRLTLSLPALEGEATARNNQLDLWLDVREDTASVLFLDSGARWEERFLRATWERDRSVTLSSHLVEPPPRRALPPEFPRSEAELFTFDLIVLGDVEPTLFSPDERDRLVRFVSERGGTLLLIAGPRAMPFAWSGTLLEPLLPVALPSPSPPRDAGADLARDGAPLSLSLLAETDPLCRLTPGRTRNAQLWRLLPPPRWIAPVRNALADAETLVEARPVGQSESWPVLVRREHEAGKVLYCGVDSTWRWRYRQGDLLYTRFWGQVVRWAKTGSLPARDARLRLGTDRVLYGTDDSIRVSVFLEATDAEVSTTPERVIARFESEDRIHEVPLLPSRPGSRRHTATLPVRDVIDSPDPISGTRPIAVSIALPDRPESIPERERAKLRLAVTGGRPDEALDLVRDQELLADISRLSGASPASLPDPTGALVEALRSLPEARTLRVEQRLFDHGVAIGLVLFGLLALEWILRARARLA